MSTFKMTAFENDESDNNRQLTINNNAQLWRYNESFKMTTLIDIKMTKSKMPTKNYKRSTIIKVDQKTSTRLKNDNVD
jgi:hypothetical protein